MPFFQVRICYSGHFIPKPEIREGVQKTLAEQEVQPVWQDINCCNHRCSCTQVDLAWNIQAKDRDAAFQWGQEQRRLFEVSPYLSLCSSVPEVIDLTMFRIKLTFTAQLDRAETMILLDQLDSDREIDFDDYCLSNNDNPPNTFTLNFDRLFSREEHARAWAKRTQDRVLLLNRITDCGQDVIKASGIEVDPVD